MEIKFGHKYLLGDKVVTVGEFSDVGERTVKVVFKDLDSTGGISIEWVQPEELEEYEETV